jgi:hypothetical protein
VIDLALLSKSTHFTHVVWPHALDGSNEHGFAGEVDHFAIENSGTSALDQWVEPARRVSGLLHAPFVDQGPSLNNDTVPLAIFPVFAKCGEASIRSITVLEAWGAGGFGESEG